MAVALLLGDDDLCVFLKIVVDAQTHQELAGQLWIEAIVDIQIVVIQQKDVLFYREGEIRVYKPPVQHCFFQIVGVIEPEDHTVTALFIRYEQYIT